MRKNGKKSIKTKKKTKSNVDMVEFDFTKMLAGRPTIMTEAIVAKLEMAFSLGANDSMACRYAGIDRKTLWRYQQKYPGFLEHKMALKDELCLQYLQTIHEAVKGNYKLALRFLKKRLPETFDV